VIDYVPVCTACTHKHSNRNSVMSVRRNQIISGECSLFFTLINMGGNAFRQAGLSEHAFPRMPPPIYDALKVRITPLLEQFYSHVRVPTEAPAKPDHGDLDFTVALPLTSAASYGSNSSEHQSSESNNEPAVEHFDPKVIRAGLGAVQCISRPGPGQTSNYAILILQGEWGAFGHEYSQLEEEYRRKAKMDLSDANSESSSDIYYQVSILRIDDAGCSGKVETVLTGPAGRCSCL
jgi:hypothetical protein